jgi:hypothetical protein
VDIIYGELWAGRMALPATDGRELVARGALSVELGPEDMPPFVAVPESQPVFTRTSIRQLEGLDQADDVLVNSLLLLPPSRCISPLSKNYLSHFTSHLRPIYI